MFDKVKAIFVGMLVTVGIATANGIMEATDTGVTVADLEEIFPDYLDPFAVNADALIAAAGAFVAAWLIGYFRSEFTGYGAGVPDSE